MGLRTNSDVVINGLSGRFGTVDYDRWQMIRWQWYGYTTYPLAGSTSLSFFGNAVGQGSTNLADTNLPKAGSFGQQHFLIKTISTSIKLTQQDLGSFTVANIATCDQRSLASDYLHGFVQAGLLTFNIGSRPFAQIPKPFLYCPHVAPEPLLDVSSAPQASAAGANASDYVCGTPNVSQLVDRDGVYRFDPNILIEAEQQFEVKITYDSGLVPVISTGLNPAINDTTAPLKVGVVLDGYLLRPRQ